MVLSEKVFKIFIAILISLFSFTAISVETKSEDLEKSNQVISVSGAKGKNGDDGKSHHGHASTSTPGRRGGNAESGEAGKNAGEISVWLKDAKGQLGFVEFSGQYTATSGANRSVQRQLRMARTGNIRLLSRGGDGGNGGNGGNGEGGGKGYDGTDATKWSSGT